MPLYSFKQDVGFLFSFLLKWGLICINWINHYFQVEDVLSDTDWPFVKFCCVNAIQYSDHNIILPRLALLRPLKTLPSYVLVCTFISGHSIIITILLLSYCYHCRAFIFFVETESFRVFCPLQIGHSKVQLVC